MSGQVYSVCAHTWAGHSLPLTLCPSGRCPRGPSACLPQGLVAADAPPFPGPSEVGGQDAGFASGGAWGSSQWRLGESALWGHRAVLDKSVGWGWVLIRVQQTARGSTQQPLLVGMGPPVPSRVWTGVNCPWPPQPWECSGARLPSKRKALSQGDCSAGGGIASSGREGQDWGRAPSPSTEASFAFREGGRVPGGLPHRDSWAV